MNPVILEFGMQESQLSGEITRRTFGMKIVRNGGQETRQTCALTSWKGGCCGRKAGWGFHESSGVDRPLPCRAETIQLAEAKAKADQVKTTQQRMLRHHRAWPLGREIRTGSPGATLCLEYELFYANESYCIISGSWCQRRTVVTCSLFIKLFILVESLCLTLYQIIAEWWLTSNLHDMQGHS